MIHLGDICKINGAEIPRVDVITFGSPCQDVSVAGARKGIVHTEHGGEETTRSGLFFEAIRVIREMREADKEDGRADEFIRPRFGILENVPGLFSSNKGEDFRAVLTEIVRIAEPDAPDAPMPDIKGGVAVLRMPVRRHGRMVRGLEGTRSAILGMPAAEEKSLRFL